MIQLEDKSHTMLSFNICISMELVRLMKIILKEISNKVRLSDGLTAPGDLHQTHHVL
jgi:hypothetical protein